MWVQRRAARQNRSARQTCVAISMRRFIHATRGQSTSKLQAHLRCNPRSRLVVERSVDLVDDRSLVLLECGEGGARLGSVVEAARGLDEDPIVACRKVERT